MLVVLGLASVWDTIFLYIEIVPFYTHIFFSFSFKIYFVFGLLIRYLQVKRFDSPAKKPTAYSKDSHKWWSYETAIKVKTNKLG